MKQKWKGQIKLCSPEPMGCVISETQVFMFFSFLLSKMRRREPGEHGVQVETDLRAGYQSVSPFLHVSMWSAVLRTRCAAGCTGGSVPVVWTPRPRPRPPEGGKKKVMKPIQTHYVSLSLDLYEKRPVWAPQLALLSVKVEINLIFYKLIIWHKLFSLYI